MGNEIPFRRGERIAVRADIRLSAADGRFAEVTLIDISRFGVSVDGLKHLQQRALLDLAFPNGGERKGRAVWNEDFLEGIAFEPPLEADEFAVLLRSLQI